MNTFGRYFRVTTFGESHGIALGAVIDGCPAGFSFDAAQMQAELNRRKPGQSVVSTPRVEKDQVEIVSGIFEGKTLGTPIACLVRNENQHSSDYDWLKTVFRPGHADEMWQRKYHHKDHRGGGRSSGRETIGRVMAGSLAKKILYASSNTKIIGHVCELGGVVADPLRFDREVIETNMVRCADPIAAIQMEQAVMEAKKKSESVGGAIEIIITNPPVCLGNPVFGKLEGELSRAVLSCGAVRSFEYGIGIAAKDQVGSVQNQKKEGISGGISTGDTIVLRMSIKPTPSISQPQKVQTNTGEQDNFIIGGRHDPTIPPRLVPVLEAMVALVLVDFLLAPPDRIDQIAIRDLK